MEGLLSLFLFAISFYFVMRFGFGCGVHMKHEHGGSHNHGKQNEGQKKHTDPVCGMEVDVEQGYEKFYEGILYRFCSRDCLDKFDADPEQYVIKNPDYGEHHHEGGEL